MSATLTEVPAAICEWCGQANAERLPQCAGCGTRLVTEPIPAPETEAETKPKSRILAVCLSLIFGPLGLLYVNAWGTTLLMFAIAIPLLFTHAGGLWITFGFRFFCAALAYSLIKENATVPDSRRDSQRLLDAAARLESVDREKAIAAYREVVRLYPNTAASGEATRNIQILTQHKAQ